MKIKLTAACPECDNEMVINMRIINSTDLSLDITYFEQQTFHCDDCDMDFHTGNIDLLSDKDLNE